MKTKMIFCTGCGCDVSARLTGGKEIYPHRRDLYDLPFWKCDSCGNFVGCHHKTKDRTRPLGVIPTPAIKAERQKIHRLLDPIWKRKKMKRGNLYAEVAKRLGIEEYHTAELRSVADAQRAHSVIAQISQEVA